MAKKPKKLDPICRNCRLYDGKKGICNVLIIAEIEGIKDNRHHLPVNPDDPCFFENEFVALNGEAFIPAEEIKEVKFWVEDPKTGEKTTGNGIVKMEYDVGLFERTPHTD